MFKNILSQFFFLLTRNFNHKQGFSYFLWHAMDYIYLEILGGSQTVENYMIIRDYRQ
jgi:hypothetical protein